MKIIIIILQAILNFVRKRRDLIANRSKIPPEYRDDVVVWYSPKKQKLTNYDVIESYAEDFLSNKWVNRVNVNATITSKTITYNRRVYDRNRILSTNKSCESFIIYATVSTYAWRYQYVDKDGVTKFYDIKNGINILPKSYNNGSVTIGFLWMGNDIETSIYIEQLPASILKDFSGNGHDAYLYGFQGKLNSGVGIYQTDFTAWGTVSTSGTKEIKPNSLHITNVNKTNNAFIYTTEKVNAFKVKIEGDFNGLTFRYIYDSVNDGVLFINSPGIYDFPAIENANYNNGFYGSVFGGDCDITVTQIPDYPNSLCYADKQYCKAYNLPILDDYTIIARRTWFNKTSRNTFISNATYANNGAFVFEIFDIQGDTVYTFGNSNKVIFTATGISYQTKTKYNDRIIAAGTAKSSNTIWIGHLRDNDGTFNGCHDDIILLNRSLTVDEINDITKAVFKEDILKPIFDLKATDVINVVNDGGGN